MKRLALVLTVAAIAAVSCTTPGVTPTTTTSSSTTLAGASAREAVFTTQSARNYGIDSAFYPSGATVSAQVDAPPSGICAALAAISLPGGVFAEVPGTRVCEPTEAVVAGLPPVFLTLPTAIGSGRTYYAGVQVDPSRPENLNYIETAPIYVRW
jgi:hypothetical protein